MAPAELLWERIMDARALEGRRWGDAPSEARSKALDPHRVRLFDYLASDALLFEGDPIGFLPEYTSAALADFGAHAQTDLRLAVKAALLLGERGNRRKGVPRTVADACNALHAGGYTLFDLHKLLVPFGYSAGDILYSMCSTENALAVNWPPASIAPFCATHARSLAALVSNEQFSTYAFERAVLFAVLARLPAVPPAVADALFDIASGSAATERVAAQDALRKAEGISARVAALLASGKAPQRIVAANWLQRLGDPAAVAALSAALAKEKHDGAKAAMLDALHGLGQPLEAFFDRGALARDAAKAGASAMPPALAWFPWQVLPPVRWADDGAAVPAEVLRLLIVQAVKRKLPEPDAVMRHFCALFEAQDRAALGQFLLDAWLAEDTRSMPSDQAYAQAREQSGREFASGQVNGIYTDMFGDDYTAEELYQQHLDQLLGVPLGSAADSKGLLALAAACAGAQAAGSAARYLKDYYGNRAAQCKALLGMLAWVEHPGATQLLLAVGSRFRTRSIQDEAQRLAEALAARKGWSLAELAERSVPDAGFDAHGLITLDSGVQVRLQPDLSLALASGAGKKVAAPASLRKELKAIDSMQTARLYEAMCSGRVWRFDDWQRYLHTHPVLRHMVQRLVWVEAGGNSFRPLADGSLSTLDDTALALAPDSRVQLAHDTLLPAALVAQWQAHLADYAVTPLFCQLGRGAFVLPESAQHSVALHDFEGYMLGGFALRNEAARLGYERGPREGGTWFSTYRRHYPTLGLNVYIHFSGNSLPEEDRAVALGHLRFWRHGQVPMGEVPPVLLSECMADLRAMAALGSGHQPQWRKKLRE